MGAEEGWEAELGWEAGGAEAVGLLGCWTVGDVAEGVEAG